MVLCMLCSVVLVEWLLKAMLRGDVWDVVGDVEE